MMRATAIVLAGGKSKRMGENKSLLRLGKKTIIESVVDELKGYFEKTLIVTNAEGIYDFMKLPTLSDTYKNKGPLAGIHAGLTASETSANFIAACDMPFISGKIASLLVQELERFDAVVPIIGGRLQPLYAAYSKTVVGHIALKIQENQLSLRGLLHDLHVNYVQEDYLREMIGQNMVPFFYNMNTQDDYKKGQILFHKMKEEDN